MLDVVQQGSTTYETTTPVIDPVTDVPTTVWTVEHETETQRVESGYDALGRTIQVLLETTPVQDPVMRAVNISRRTRSVEDVITSYGYQGELLTDFQPYQSARSGPQPSYSQITDGVVLDAEALDTMAVLSAQSPTLANSAGPRARARRVDPDRIEVLNELSPDVFGPATASAAARMGSRGTYVRTWRRHGRAYLLERTELTSEWEAQNGVRKTERQVEHIRMVKLHQNARRDAERRARRVSETGSGGFTLASLGDQPGDNCVVGQDCPPDDPPPPPSNDCQPVPGGAHILHQHGINSDRHAFLQSGAWLCTVAWERIQETTIDWRRRITSQRDELRDSIRPGMHDIILIGHSNGGLVTRSLAQWAQVNQPGLVRGVITLDSPNQGAIVAKNLAVANRLLGPGAAALGLGLRLMDEHPFYVDDVPNSAFLQSLNSFSENFVNVGIRTQTPKRWVAWRILATGECLPRTPCELAVVKRTQKRYDDMRHTAKVWYRPWHSIPAGIEQRAMNAFDRTWNALTAPDDIPGDGFIHTPGQYYPGARRNRLIENGDSHTGTTKSEHVFDALTDALHDQQLFGLQGNR
ncbi:MAG TPA: hypothetical protein VF665_12900 [Longimicrobium sp.]